MKDLAEIRNDVVGSLLRPAGLKQARQRYDERKLSAEDLRQLEDREIRNAVSLQEELGLAVVTDGEYRRLNFQDSFGESVSGYDAGKASLKFYEQRVEGSNPCSVKKFNSGEEKAQRFHKDDRLSNACVWLNTPLEEYPVSRETRNPRK
jgi:5-methyltetrahydropteroyltriglutamate--homocysteine methyltransferase